MFDITQFDVNRIPYFICVGTVRNKIDMIAPCIGSILERNGFCVMGTEEDNLHALNMIRRLDEVKDIDPRIYQIIGIDASLSNNRVSISKGALKPGSGMRKEWLPEIGESAIRLSIHNELPPEEQMWIMIAEHEKYEDETRTLAAEVAHEIMRIYHHQYGYQHMRIMNTAKLVLSGYTFKDIEVAQGYGHSTAHNDIKKLKDINAYLYDACRESIEENTKNSLKRACIASVRARERKKNAVKVQQLRFDSDGSIVGDTVVLLDSGVSNKNH